MQCDLLLLRLVFPCGKWLDEKQEDGQIEQVPEAVPKPEQKEAGGEVLNSDRISPLSPATGTAGKQRDI